MTLIKILWIHSNQVRVFRTSVFFQFRCCGAANYSDWYCRPNSTALPATVDTRYKSCESYARAAFSRPDWVFAPFYIETNESLAVPESCCISPCRGCSRRIHPSNIFTSVSGGTFIYRKFCSRRLL